MGASVPSDGRVHPGGAHVRVDALPWDEACRRHADDWSRLVREAGLNPSLHPAWMEAALGSHGLAASTTVCVVTRGGALTGVLPVTLSSGRLRGVPVRIADLASNTVAYHPELAGLPPLESLLALALDGALAGRWDVLRAYNIVDHGPTSRAVAAWATQRGYVTEVVPGEQSPYIAIAADWPAFLQSRPKKFRANVSRMLRRPSEQGTAEMVWYEAGADVSRLLDDMLVIERASWKAREGIAIADRPAEARYYRQLLPYLEAGGMLLANVLVLDGQPVAYVLCCQSSGWCGQLKTSFIEGTKDAGGAVITASVMRAFERGATEYDFLGDADPHKLKWTDTTRPHSNYLVVAPTWRGRAVAALGRLRASVGNH